MEQPIAISLESQTQSQPPFPLLALPRELQSLIWQATLPSRLVELFFDTRSKHIPILPTPTHPNVLHAYLHHPITGLETSPPLRATTPLPVALQVCVLSRSSVIHLYPFSFPMGNHPALTRFNLFLDSIFLQPHGNHRDTFPLLLEASPEESEIWEVKQLVVEDWGVVNSLMYPGLDTWSDGVRELVNRMWSVEKVVSVGENRDGWLERHKRHHDMRVCTRQFCGRDHDEESFERGVGYQSPVYGMYEWEVESEWAFEFPFHREEKMEWKRYLKSMLNGDEREALNLKGHVVEAVGRFLPGDAKEEEAEEERRSEEEWFEGLTDELGRFWREVERESGRFPVRVVWTSQELEEVEKARREIELHREPFVRRVGQWEV